MIMTDLRELKLILEIDPNNTVEDAKLSLFIMWATDVIEGVLNRPGLMLKERTEYYGGTGTQKILLKNRPVLLDPVPQVYVDENGFFGSSSGAFTSNTSELTFGVDFCLDAPNADEPSKSGILIRINRLWPRPSARVQGLLSPFLTQSYGNVKVVYWGGYSNDTLPNDIRMAAVALVSKMRGFWPVGFELSSDSEPDKNISILAERKNYLTAMTKSLLWRYNNWRM